MFVYDENENKFTYKNRYWGILFDKVKAKKIENVSIAGQNKKIIFDSYAEQLETDYNNFIDYTKYFKNDYLGNSNNIWIEDLEDNNIDYLNSFFHLERCIPLTNELVKLLNAQLGNLTVYD